MSLTVALRIVADGKSAKGEVRGATDEIRKLGATTKEAGQQAAAAARQQNTLAREISTIEAAAKKATSAQEAQARAVAQANAQAAGSFSNLETKLYNVGRAVAYGRNALVDMVQNIAHGFGKVAAGALGTWAGALLQALNPVNLLTGAVIGFGAAAVQWFMGATEKADKFASALERAAAAATATQDKINRLRFGIDDDYQVEILQDQVRLRAEYNSKVGQLNTYLATTTESIDLQRIKTAALIADITATTVAYQQNERLLSDQAALTTQLAILEGIRAQRAGEAAAAAAEAKRVAEDTTWAQEAIAALTLQAELQALITRYGQDSAIVAAVRANAEREVYGAMVASLEVSVALKAELMNAYDAAKGIAAVNIAAAIDAAVGRAAALAGNLWNAARASSAIKPLTNIATNVAGGVKNWASGVWSNMVTMASSGKGTGTGTGSGVGTGSAGGGGGAAKAETNAIADLIKKQELELEILRETNPVKKEMLRYREQMAGATEAEKKELEQSITTLIEVKAAMEGLKTITGMAGNSMIDALMGANDAGEKLIETLFRAGLQATLLGEGPLAGMFGSEGTGGLLGKLGQIFLPMKKASGGHISGPGTATSDSIPAMLSNGEFVVNAAATTRNRGILEAINGGARLRGFAGGGAVSSGSGGGGSSSGGNGPRLVINNYSSEPIHESPNDGPDPEEMITLTVGRQTARGKFDRPNRARFGLTPQVTSR